MCGLQEIAGATNARIRDDLRTRDQTKGYWLNDDPSLQAILTWISNHGGR